MSNPEWLFQSRYLFTQAFIIHGQIIVFYFLFKVPGRAKLSYIEVMVFDEESKRDMPIKLSQGMNLGPGTGFVLRYDGSGSGFINEDDTLIFPGVSVPKCGAAFDFYPFPSGGIGKSI